MEPSQTVNAAPALRKSKLRFLECYSTGIRNFVVFCFQQNCETENRNMNQLTSSAFKPCSWTVFWSSSTWLCSSISRWLINLNTEDLSDNNFWLGFTFQEEERLSSQQASSSFIFFPNFIFTSMSWSTVSVTGSPFPAHFSVCWRLPADSAAARSSRCRIPPEPASAFCSRAEDGSCVLCGNTRQWHSNLLGQFDRKISTSVHKGVKNFTFSTVKWGKEASFEGFL